jgi:hypothetical protein
MKTTLALILVFATQTCCAARVRAQSPSAVGRWKVDITFTDASQHSLRFDVQDSGKGSFLLLDSRSSLLDPAKSSEAKWTQTGVTELDFSGAVEFPIGNVGRDVGTLVFKGTFDTADLISGEVAFFPIVQDSKDPSPKPSKTGAFKATRVPAESTTTVQLLSPSSGKLKRGREVDIDWQADSQVGIALQQLFLSLDNGESFAPISGILDGSATEFAWIVPDTLPNTKKARLKIMVVNAIGDSADDTSKETFKIR